MSPAITLLWIFSAAGLIAAFVMINSTGTRLIQRTLHREPLADRRSRLGTELYELVFVGLTFGIGIPPVFAIPDADPLLYMSCLFLGMTLGGWLAQATFGRRIEPVSSNKEELSRPGEPPLEQRLDEGR